MNNKKQPAQTFIGLALLGGLMVAGGSVQAGGFSTPTFGAQGWGRAFGGGSLFKDDPSSAYNNPAAMAFIDQTIAQQNVIYARVNIKFKGNATDYKGDPASVGVLDEFGGVTSTPRTGDGGEGGFTAWLPTGFLVIPINDRFSVGLSQVVPQGMKSTWDPDWKAAILP